MICRNCGQETDERAYHSCLHCGTPLGDGIYFPPEGFLYDSKRDVYEQVQQQEGVTYITRFNAHDGSYEVETYANAPKETMSQVDPGQTSRIPPELPKGSVWNKNTQTYEEDKESFGKQTLPKTSKGKRKGAVVGILLLLVVAGLGAVWYFDLYQELPFADKLAFIPTREEVFEGSVSRDEASLAKEELDAVKEDKKEQDVPKEEVTQPTPEPPITEEIVTLPYFTVESMNIIYQHSSIINNFLYGTTESNGQENFMVEFSADNSSNSYWSLYTFSYPLSIEDLDQIIMKEQELIMAGEINLNELSGTNVMEWFALTKETWDKFFAETPKESYILITYDSAGMITDYMCGEFTYKLNQ